MHCRALPTMCPAWAAEPQVRARCAAASGEGTLDNHLGLMHGPWCAGFTTRSDIGPARQAPEMPAGIGVRGFSVAQLHT